MHNIIDMLRASAAFTEIDVAADIPKYCFDLFRLTDRGDLPDAAHRP